MDFSTLLDTYPIVKKVIKRAPQLKEWLEKGAKEEDPAVFIYLEMRQRRDEQEDEFVGLRNWLLVLSIMTALLSNPELTDEEIE